jgi:hypothetical protein
MLFGGRNLGELSINSSYTIYTEATQIPLPGQPEVDLLGFAGGSTSDQGFIERQGTTSINWRIQPFTVTYVNRFIGESKDSPFATLPQTIDAHFYHDLQVKFA